MPDLRPDLVEREFKAQGLKQAVGGRHYLREHEERLCVHRVCHRRLLPTDRRMGIIGLDAHRGIAAASTQSSDPSVRGKQQVLFTIRITAYSTSALFTTSDLPSTALQLPPALLVTPMIMLWLKTLTAPTRTS